MSIHLIRCKLTGEPLAILDGGGQCICPSSDECKMKNYNKDKDKMPSKIIENNSK